MFILLVKNTDKMQRTRVQKFRGTSAEFSQLGTNLSLELVKV